MEKMENQINDYEINAEDCVANTKGLANAINVPRARMCIAGVS